MLLVDDGTRKIVEVIKSAQDEYNSEMARLEDEIKRENDLIKKRMKASLRSQAILDKLLRKFPQCFIVSGTGKLNLPDYKVVPFPEVPLPKGVFQCYDHEGKKTAL